MKQKFRVVKGGKPGISDDLEVWKEATDEDVARYTAKNIRPQSPRSRPRPTFVMVPHVWIDCLPRHAFGELGRLALALLYRANLGKSFAVTREIMVEAKVARQNKRRLLEQLEATGLVTIEWPSGRNAPRVTVRYRVVPRGEGA
jgi:hypothetical protein